MEFGTGLGSGIYVTIIGMGTVLFSLIIVAGLINLIKVDKI